VALSEEEVWEIESGEKVSCVSGVKSSAKLFVSFKQ